MRDAWRPNVSTDTRRALAARQGELVRALVASAPLPSGFDDMRTSTTRGTLLRKRMRGVERTWPGLARGLGADFKRLFALYAESNTMSGEGLYPLDGRRFAEWLLERGDEPTDAGRLELFHARLRGRFALAIMTFRGWQETRIGLRLPLLGAMQMRLPLYVGPNQKRARRLEST